MEELKAKCQEIAAECDAVRASAPPAWLPIALKILQAVLDAIKAK